MTKSHMIWSVVFPYISMLIEYKHLDLHIKLLFKLHDDYCQRANCYVDFY